MGLFCCCDSNCTCVEEKTNVLRSDQILIFPLNNSDVIDIHRTEIYYNYLLYDLFYFQNTHTQLSDFPSMGPIHSARSRIFLHALIYLVKPYVCRNTSKHTLTAGGRLWRRFVSPEHSHSSCVSSLSLSLPAVPVSQCFSLGSLYYLLANAQLSPLLPLCFLPRRQLSLLIFNVHD